MVLEIPTTKSRGKQLLQSLCQYPNKYPLSWIIFFQSPWVFLSFPFCPGTQTEPTLFTQLISKILYGLGFGSPRKSQKGNDSRSLRGDPRKVGVAGWVPQKVDSEMELAWKMFIKECPWNQHLQKKGKESEMGSRRRWASMQAQQHLSQPYKELWSSNDPYE